MTKLDCNTLAQLLSTFQLVKACEPIGNETLRLTTPFSYANGTGIELFVKPERPNDLFCDWQLTDLGFTTDYLLDLHMKPWATKRRQQIVTEICRSLEVSYEKGALSVLLPNDQLNNIPEAIVRLSQACIRMAELVLTQRLRTPGVFREEVEEAIAGLDIPYEPNVRLLGRFNNDVEVDFRVAGRKVTSLVATLSTPNTSAAHSLSTEVFRKWYDLEPHRKDFQFITLYDTNSNAYRDEDLKRLEDTSVLIGFPARETELSAVLAA